MNYIDKYAKWSTAKALDPEERAELLALKNNEKELKERFLYDLEFGTGGLRGVIGLGTNRINKYIVRKTTQGFAEYIKSHGTDACKRGVVIAHDNRRFSRAFCLETAGVLAANGIQAYIFDSLRPTPELSFAVRELSAFGGVVITASHNPPEYNGYKAYWDNGAQVIEPHDVGIIDEVNSVTEIKTISKEDALKSGKLVLIDKEIDEKFWKMCKDQLFRPELIKEKASSVKIPNDKDVIYAEDVEDVEEWLEEVDWDNLIEKMENADVSSDIIDEVEDIVDMLDY